MVDVVPAPRFPENLAPQLVCLTACIRPLARWHGVASWWCDLSQGRISSLTSASTRRLFAELKLQTANCRRLLRRALWKNISKIARCVCGATHTPTPTCFHIHFLIERELNARLAGRLPFAGFAFAACRLNGTRRNKNYNIAVAADDAMEMEGKQQAQLQPLLHGRNGWESGYVIQRE